MNLTLSEKDRRKLERIVRASRDGQLLRRAQGLLALAEGEPARQVVRRMRVGRSTPLRVGGPASQSARRAGAAAPSDHPRSGRPAAKRRPLKVRLQVLMAQKPAEYGYRYSGWTTGLLQLQAASEGLAGGRHHRAAGAA